MADEADRSARPPRDALFSGTGEHGLRGLARRTDSYGFVLVLLAALIWIFVPFSDTERWAASPTLAVFWLAVLISLHTSYVRGTRLVAALVVTTALLATGLIGHVIESDRLRAVSDMGYGALLFLTAAVVLRRILGHTSVTSRTLSGAVSALLLIGLAFASTATGLEVWHDGSYVAVTGNLGFAEMLYFSFVTMATLGYGDIVPVTSFARSLATFEAVLGQVYLVVVVARLVSLLGTRGDVTVPDTADTADTAEE